MELELTLNKSFLILTILLTSFLCSCSTLNGVNSNGGLFSKKSTADSKLAKQNKGSKFDSVIRHSCISALDRLASTKELIKFGTSKSVEQRLVAVILLRKRSDSNLMNFLDDDNELVRTEAIRAIYDTAALDGLAGQRLAAIKPGDYSYFIQSRIAAANFRLGTDESAVRLLSFCSNPDIDKDVKTFTGLMQNFYLH